MAGDQVPDFFRKIERMTGSNREGAVEDPSAPSPLGGELWKDAPCLDQLPQGKVEWPVAQAGAAHLFKQVTNDGGLDAGSKPSHSLSEAERLHAENRLIGDGREWLNAADRQQAKELETALLKGDLPTFTALTSKAIVDGPKDSISGEPIFLEALNRNLQENGSSTELTLRDGKLFVVDKTSLSTDGMPNTLEIDAKGGQATAAGGSPSDVFKSIADGTVDQINQHALFDRLSRY